MHLPICFIQFKKMLHLCKMRILNFPAFDFRYKTNENKTFIFDPIRKKYLMLTPEEWVRQHAVRWLIEVKLYPASVLAVEKRIEVGGLSKRYDIAVYLPDGSLFLLVECKAPEVPISQQTFDQAARYNLTLKAPFFWLTNGLNHYFCTADKQHQQYVFLKDAPSYPR